MQKVQSNIKSANSIIKKIIILGIILLSITSYSIDLNTNKSESSIELKDGQEEINDPNNLKSETEFQNQDEITKSIEKQNGKETLNHEKHNSINKNDKSSLDKTTVVSPKAVKNVNNRVTESIKGNSNNNKITSLSSNGPTLTINNPSSSSNWIKGFTYTITWALTGNTTDFPEASIDLYD
ncbi:MAG: hypothetical protein ACXAC7_20275, partial [Candidatus Hodarchaeales archaeon]